MTRPRFTLKTIMVVVAVIAVECGLLRWAFAVRDLPIGVLIGTLPAITILASLGFCMLAGGVRRSSRAWFSSGFLGVGLLALAGVVAPSLLDLERARKNVTDMDLMATHFVLEPLGLATGPPTLPKVVVRLSVLVLFVVLAYSGTVLMLAWTGGRTAMQIEHRFGQRRLT